MRHRRKLGVLLAAALTASLLSATNPSQANPAAFDFPAGQLTSGPRTVTLITGDEVTVHGDNHLSVPPRAGIRFLTHTSPGHHYVIPSDALGPLREGRLDRRLFDIDALLEARYDRRDTLPLLISGGTPKGVLASRPLPAISGHAFSATAKQLREGWKSLAAPGAKIWLDGLRKPSLDVTVPQVGAPAAWSAGFDGTGVKVAVLDTGIDATHPDLAGKIVAAHNFAAGEEDELDRVGHGTHVASTIAGSGAASNSRYKGVAPGATLLDGKVCVEYGCAESWILEGMHWAAESGAQVVNLSLGGQDTPELDPLEQAINDLTAQYGILFVVAAGNSGFIGDYSLQSPASADAALAVGAVDKNDELAHFSSRGPRVGDAATKPELTAPGVDVVAARSKDGFLGEPGEQYATLSGTSMATPHVAGAAAILAQKYPDWTAEQHKAMLTGSAAPNSTDGPFAQGGGRLDVARAISAPVSANPATVSFGVQTWPHEDDPVLVKPVTYRNTGDTDITLSLSLTDTFGGTFSLSANSVTVPAGGSATISLTADTRQGTTVGPIGGRLVATADGVRVQTPFGVEREEQKFRIEVTHTDRDGAPAELWFTSAWNLGTGVDYNVTGSGDTGTAQVPAGTYLLWGIVMRADGQGGVELSQLTWPKLEVSGDREINVDARQAGAIKVSVPDRSLTPLLAAAGLEVQTDTGTFGASVLTGDPDSLFIGHLGPEQVPGVTGTAQVIWGRVVDEQLDPTILASLAWAQPGSSFKGLDKQLSKRDIVTVKERHARNGVPMGEALRLPRIAGLAWALVVPQELPSERTHLLNADVAWQADFNEVVEDEFYSYTFGQAVTYRAGKTYHERFNQAVSGPVLPDSSWPSDWISRQGNNIAAQPPLNGDGAGRAGFSRFNTARTALYRDGQLVGERPDPAGFFQVPAEPGRYRLESTIERAAPFRLSTKVHVVWGFESSHVEEVKRLPVTAIGFSPALDDHNRARAGATMLIPIRVSQQPGSDARPLRRLTVSVSHDDGATWSEARVLTLLGQRFLLLKNPAAPGFVSLRAQAEDRDGNTVDQTVIRGYEVM